MRLTALLAVIFLPLSAALPQHAQAAGECIEASALSGPAPLHVSFRATCGAAAYRWDFGDGSTAVGAETAHDFTAGAFTVTLERTFLDGSSTRTSVDIASFALQLDRLPATRYGSERVFRGSLVPAASGVEVILERAGEAITSTRTDNSGRFAFRVRVINPGPYVVRAGDVVSAEITVKVRPRLHISLSGLPLVGQPLRLRIRVQPVESGEVELVALRDNRRVIDRQVDAGKAVALPTGRVARYVLWVTLRPAERVQLLEVGRTEAGLLVKDAPGGRAERLGGAHEVARQRPEPFERRALALEEEDVERFASAMVGLDGEEANVDRHGDRVVCCPNPRESLLCPNHRRSPTCRQQYP